MARIRLITSGKYTGVYADGNLVMAFLDDGRNTIPPELHVKMEERGLHNWRGMLPVRSYKSGFETGNFPETLHVVASQEIEFLLQNREAIDAIYKFASDLSKVESMWSEAGILVSLMEDIEECLYKGVI